jgi:hypothetical protein
LKKRLTIILVSLTFVGLFFYFYRKSGKFRQSIIAALLAALVLSSGPLDSEAKGADAFTSQPEMTRASRNRSLFSSGARKPSNDGPGKPDNSGSGGDDDDKGFPQYSKPETVEETENRIDRIDEYSARMDESSDSEEESESNQCPVNKTQVVSIIERSSRLEEYAKDANEKYPAEMQKLRDDLGSGHFKSGRGSRKMPGSKTIYYMRSGQKVRLYYRYSKTEERTVEIVAETSKNNQPKTIKLLKKMYK